MPLMPRTNKKARKIAYKILGKPNNIKYQKPPWSAWVDKRLLFEDTSRQR